MREANMRLADIRGGAGTLCPGLGVIPGGSTDLGGGFGVEERGDEQFANHVQARATGAVVIGQRANGAEAVTFI